MSMSLGDKRKAENEAVFRQHNELIQKNRDHLNELAIEDGQHDLIDNDNLLLQFVCECSDENCNARISMYSNKYNQIHKNRKRFIVVRGHETLEIERIIGVTTNYTIVEKDIRPSEDNPRLRQTDVINT
jgi:hypothetical protein